MPAQILSACADQVHVNQLSEDVSVKSPYVPIGAPTLGSGRLPVKESS